MGGNVMFGEISQQDRSIGLCVELPSGPSEAVTAGKGGARERAQVSPKEEPEQSGLCDDVDGGKCYVWGKIPAGLSAWRSHAAAKRRTSIFAELKS